MFRSGLRCERCGREGTDYGMENVPPHIKPFIRGEVVIVARPIGICGECYAVLCSDCADNGRCTECDSPFPLLAECPSTPPDDPTMIAKWGSVYEAQFGTLAGGYPTLREGHFLIAKGVLAETFLSVMVSVPLSAFFDSSMLPFLVNGAMLGISIAILMTFLQFWLHERLSPEIHVTLSLVSGVLTGIIAGIVTGISRGEMFWNWLS